MLKRQVQGHGSFNSSILIIGEAPGTTEVSKGEPFIGWSGQFLREMCERAGIVWSETRVDNVVQFQPPNNDFSIFYNKKEPTPELLAWWTDLRHRILEVRPKVIIAAGDHALVALTGNRSSTLWRGSVIPYKSDDLECWIIPIVHPSYARRCYNMTSSKRKEVRQPWFHITVYDLKKAKQVSEKSWEPLPRTEKIFPTYVDVMDYLNKLHAMPSDTMLTIDIETHQRRHVSCIGITHKKDYAMCIPFIANRNGKPFYSIYQEHEIWSALDKTLSIHLICGQTVGFDLAHLWRDIGLVVTPQVFADTAILHALLYPELKHDLGFLSSIYTDMPYFKYLGRISESKANIGQLFEYNCFDVQATHEVAEKLIEEAKTAGMWEYYLSKRRPLSHWAIDQHRRGLTIDLSRQREIADNIIKDDITPTETAFKKALIESDYEEVNPRSPQQVVSLLKTLGYQISDSTEETLSSLVEDKGSVVSKTIMDLRSNYSLLTSVSKPPDSDNRFRTAIALHTTETTRLSSTKSHFGTGANMQNVTQRARPLFCASPRMILLEFDLSQAEARAVAWYCGDEGYKNMFKKGVDIHLDRAQMILEVEEKHITYMDLKSMYIDGNPDIKRYRYGAKAVGVHATNYDVGPRTVVSSLRHHGIFLNTKQEALLRANTHERFPGIRLYQWGVQNALKNTRTLTTAKGMRRYFFSKLDNNTFRRAYAFLPQCTIAEITNDAIVETRLLIEELGGAILLQVHDSILVEVPTSKIQEAHDIIVSALEKPLTVYPFFGEPDELIIPVETKVGSHWGELTLWNSG